MITNLIEQLKRDEGEVLHVYLDSRGIRTAGVGHNLEAHGIDLPVGTPVTQEQSDAWLQDDVANAEVGLAHELPWSEDLDPVRNGALANMCFNMGIVGLLGFRHFLEALQEGNYNLASLHMLNSLWAKQVGARATRLSEQVITGVWQ